MFNQDLTIVNKWFNKETKQNEYKIHHLKGFWSTSKGISISGTNLVKTDGLTARILMSEIGYQTPKEFQNNPVDWTLQNDDYIVKGIVNEVTTISKLKEDYQECMKITNIAIKDYSSESMKHYAISGE